MLVQRASQGESIIVTARNEPVAALVPLQELSPLVQLELRGVVKAAPMSSSEKLATPVKLPAEITVAALISADRGD